MDLSAGGSFVCYQGVFAFINFFDGFRTSHRSENKTLTYDDL